MRPYFCNRCHAWATVGSHKADGSFDPRSVLAVTDPLVDAAIARRIASHYRTPLNEVHYDVALGLHVGATNWVAGQDSSAYRGSKLVGKVA